MKYTVRFAHMEKAPAWKVGDTIKRGDVIGRMGTSGQSTAAHVHMDVVEGFQVARYQLKDIEADSPKAAPPRQAALFLTKDADKGYELFGITPIVTTHMADPEYLESLGKIHFHYDVVPEDRERWVKGVKVGSKAHFDIHWPRSAEGKILRVDYDEKGYGHCLYVGFEA